MTRLFDGSMAVDQLNAAQIPATLDQVQDFTYSSPGNPKEPLLSHMGLSIPSAKFQITMYPGMIISFKAGLLPGNKMTGAAGITHELKSII